MKFLMYNAVDVTDRNRFFGILSAYDAADPAGGLDGITPHPRPAPGRPLAKPVRFISPSSGPGREVQGFPDRVINGGGWMIMGSMNAVRLRAG